MEWVLVAVLWAGFSDGIPIDKTPAAVSITTGEFDTLARCNAAGLAMRSLAQGPSVPGPGNLVFKCVRK